MILLAFKTSEDNGAILDTGNDHGDHKAFFSFNFVELKGELCIMGEQIKLVVGTGEFTTTL